jgi:integrase/recombinase XerC
MLGRPPWRPPIRASRSCCGWPGRAGLRRGEVARVHTRDLLEGADGALLLVHGKGDKERVVPIADELGESIRHGAAGHTAGASRDGWLFPNGAGGHLTPWHVGNLVVRVLPDNWTMHTLRHRFASRAYRGTRNLRAVQKLLGHESIATTERYVNPRELHQTGALPQVAWRVGDGNGPTTSGRHAA